MPLVAGMVLGASHPAFAVTLDGCRAEVENLHNALPGGISDSWTEIIRERLDHVNSISDPGALQSSREQLWAESDAYDRDPDPDGDGYALAPEVFAASQVLWNCLHTARAGELEDGDQSDASEQEAASDDKAEKVAEDLSAPPVKIDASEPWFAGEDFPDSAVRDGRQGDVRYDLTVGADGKVVGCQASGPPNSPDLESATCTAVMTRARFKPALNAAGAPVVGEISGSVRWTLP